ncbi:GTP-binding protein gtr1 [Serendipita sp. 396]|nr:GTP-binding protein gtr1 [Serendipita sp. 396]KAG8777159.1 GTP-binding protein gtr1 [Serendipita sp. 397]KAG8827997.1 GTP-binding protein gtr1 [Serendipita sp. 401]KAG8861614.1 GTP-binding protein gtr1 [Serendipita sp. 411]KAG8865844.1 GTP-binding protein gtr1 [Serendipita sp. 405]KAG9058261.1 GTP-binding protein gtr1 [Serendipita sp. 407]
MPPLVKKKVLLMGRSGSGKTSMRSVIFQNTLPSLTHRLGATIDVEQSHQRFLGSLILNLWDCGGQSSFLESYLAAQKSTVFAHAGVLIYVFDVDAGEKEWKADMQYFKDCLRVLYTYSPEAAAFVLVHKMDLIPTAERAETFDRKKREILTVTRGIKLMRIFGTSIWDETLYKAWSQIVHTLIPNAAALKRGLTTLTRACGAVEAVLFEKTTFLLIAHSEGLRNTMDENLLMASSSSSTVSTDTSSHPGTSSTSTDGSNGPPSGSVSDGGTVSTAEQLRLQHLSRLSANRFERVSSILKIFKLRCLNWTTEKWVGLHIQLPGFTAVIEPLTVNSYVMVLSADEKITTEAIKINIRMAKQKFEDLQAGSV